MRKIINILFTLSLVTGLVALMAFAENRFYRKSLKEWSIDIKVAGPDTLIGTNEIEAMIVEEFNELNGKTLSNIDYEKITSIVSGMPYVERCDINLAFQGSMRVTAIQRTPVVRVMTTAGSFYLDNEARYIPATPGRAAYLPVISTDAEIAIPGQINAGEPADLHAAGLQHAFNIITEVNKDALLAQLIDQVHLESGGEYIMITKVPGPVIRLGPPENIKEKLWHLRWFALKVLPVAGWSNYKEINLKYHMQVICSK
jgi:cell division protein FtsQ